MNKEELQQIKIELVEILDRLKRDGKHYEDMIRQKEKELNTDIEYNKKMVKSSSLQADLVEKRIAEIDEELK